MNARWCVAKPGGGSVSSRFLLEYPSKTNYFKYKRIGVMLLAPNLFQQLSSICPQNAHRFARHICPA